MQVDPNASGQVVIGSIAHGGAVMGVRASEYDLKGRFGDGANLYQYVRGNPLSGSDPTGLFIGLLGPTNTLQFATDQMQTTMEHGGKAKAGLESLFERYAVDQEHDLDWAGDWSQGDDWNSRVARGFTSPERTTEAASDSGSVMADMAVWKGIRSNLVGVSRALYTQRRLEFKRMTKNLWREEAAINGSMYSADNLERMKRGKAAVGVDGKSMAWHHIKPLSQGGTNARSNLAPMFSDDHRLVHGK